MVKNSSTLMFLIHEYFLNMDAFLHANYPVSSFSNIRVTRAISTTTEITWAKAGIRVCADKIINSYART